MANKKPSIEELKSKAEGGDVEAMIKLASIYGRDDNEDYGLDGADKIESKKWYLKASALGDIEATHCLAYFEEYGSKEYISILYKAVQMGSIRAQHSLGYLYRNQDKRSKALEWFKATYNNENAGLYYRGSSAYEIGKLYERQNTVKDYNKAIKWFETSANLKYSSAARHLAEMYETGVRTEEEVDDDIFDGHTLVLKSLENAGKWYLKAAENGNMDDWAKMADLYKIGKLVVRNYRRAFYWGLKAASSGWSSHRKILIEYFEQGIGVEKNDYEAYVWALMSTKYVSSHNLSILEKKLSEKEVPSAQSEAEYRISLCSDPWTFSQELFDYMLKKLNIPPNGHNDIHTSTPDDISTQPALEDVEQTAQPQIQYDYPDPDPSPGIAYSYLSVCKKHFNPELVTLELVVPRKLKKTETLDFTRLKISYDGRNTDAKNREVLTPFRINRAERQLLIRLAAQFSVADPERRAAAIQKILSASRESTRVSHLNAMFRAIFSGCAKTRDERMINRQSGYIAPKLKIDTTKITNARDYPLCGL